MKGEHMRKLYIGLLILGLAFLTGCTSSKEAILESFDHDIKVCQDTCDIDLQSFSDYVITYRENLEAYQLTIAENKNEDRIYLNTGNTYPREQISRIDPITDNDAIPIVNPSRVVSYYFDLLEFYTSMIDMGNDLYKDSNTNITYQITNRSYGFDAYGGYYDQTVTYTSDVQGIISIKSSFIFNISPDNLEFEASFYYPNTGKLVYNYLFNDIYRAYSYVSNDEYSFKYIDINTGRHIGYTLDNGAKETEIYDPETQMFYEQHNSKYSVSLYHDMECVTFLTYALEDYLLQFSLYFMDGWDQLTYNDYFLRPYSSVYNAGYRVFSDFNIMAYPNGSNYYSVNIQKNLSETELSEFNFPEEFTGDITFSQLVQAYKDLTSKENILSIENLTPDLIKEKCLEILAIIKEN